MGDRAERRRGLRQGIAGGNADAPQPEIKAQRRGAAQA